MDYQARAAHGYRSVASGWSWADNTLLRSSHGYLSTLAEIIYRYAIATMGRTRRAIATLGRTREGIETTGRTLQGIETTGRTREGIETTGRTRRRLIP